MPEGGAAAASKVAIDIGGTFTDIALATADGRIHQSKISSTPDDPSRAVIEGVAQLLAELGLDPAGVTEVMHGTTVGSNTILQRTGARTGLITTRGFRDVLEIGRIRMPDMFDLTWVKPKPLVARRHRLEVAERMAADGSIITPLDTAAVVAAGRALVADGIEAIAIAFLNSYRNPAHEQQAEALLREAIPGLLVTSSCAVLPEIKEYERTSTTVVNAYLLAAMQRYLQRLETGLRDIGVSAPILVMTSNGGMLPAKTICEKPVLAVASGPAGGVIGAARLGAARGDRDVIVFDMGGTTAKAVIVEDGRPTMTSEYEFRDGISTSSRFIKAGGYMLKVPAIDIAEVGAGGGSIAGIDKGGLLVVGPQSAGAIPGPACYGLGNDRPTVTDANVVLGFINPNSLAGGRLAIDKALSETAIAEHLATPLGLDVADAAHGIRAVANANMARAVRAVTVERGRDPRDLTLMAFGGNGGVHAFDLARQLGIPRVVVPPLSGVFCSVGMAVDVDARLAVDGYRPDRRVVVFEADLRHEGQASELTVPLDGDDLEQLRERFAAEYFKTYGYLDTTPVELMKLRAIGRGLRDNRLDFADMKIAPRAGSSGATSRAVSFARGEPAVSVPIVGRDALGGVARPGPLIVEEFDATVVVPPDATVYCDSIGCIVVEITP